MLPLMVSGGGGGSSITLNPTNNVLPKLSSATSFVDSCITDNGTIVSFTEQITISAAQPQATLGANGGTAGQLALAGNTSGTATIGAPAVAGTRTNPIAFSNAIQLGTDGTSTNPAICFAGATNTGFARGGSGEVIIYSGGIAGASILTTGITTPAGKVFAFTNGGADSGFSRLGAALIAVGSGANGSRAGLLVGGNSAFVTADFTTAANTNLQTITGLSISVPAVAVNYNFHVHLAYSIATAVAAVSFGIQAATNAPTNIFATGEMQITVGPPATYVAGVLPTLTTTTATAIVTGTPGVIATLYTVDIYGTIENPASANTFNICVKTATAADAVTVKRGSYISFNV